MPAPSREVEYWDDFSGGLNLSEYTQALAKNETPDAVNVDFGQRGGFVLRGGFQTVYDSDLMDGAFIIGSSYFSSDVVLVQTNAGDLYSWNGSSMTDTTHNVTDDGSVRCRMATFNDVAYIMNGRNSSAVESHSWDGTTFRTFASFTFNDDYLTPVAQGSGQFPPARYAAQFAGHMFVADVMESGTRYPARVRFSHTQNPENWATDDWFMVGEPGDGDPITAMVNFGPELLIFKRKSVWRVFGTNRDNFVLEEISSASGVCTCGAVAVNSGVAYWFSTDSQLMAYNGKGIVPMSRPIDWWAHTGKFQEGGNHRLMWSGHRLWMSIQAGAAESVDRWLFLYDPSAKAFSRYDVEVSEVFAWWRSGTDSDALFIVNPAELTDEDGNILTDGSGNTLFAYSPGIFRYDRQYVTDVTSEGTSRIDGYFRTSWLDAGETATRKRWKRPRVTAAALGDATIRVEVFHDFDDQNVKRTQQFQILAPESGSKWGEFNWGDNWGRTTDEFYGFERLASTGSARSVSYKFSSMDNTSRWWVDGLAVPFRRKQVR